MDNKWGIDLSYYHTCACPRCRRNGKDTAGDNLTVYGEGQGAYCHACEFTILSDDEKIKRGLDVEEEYEEDEVSTREPITDDENKQIKGYTGTKSKGWRGIRDETNVPYGVRYSYDEETGQPDKQYVPTTIGGKLVGYKTRIFPKDFSEPVGVVGKDCELIGQFRYKNGGRVILIVGGEVDMLSAEQMLGDYQESKGYERIPVVTPSVGEGGSVRQIQAQYDFFDKFEKIIVGMDNDEAGKKALEKIVPVLPKGKVYVAEWTKKDPNAMLTAGMEKTFVNDYFRALNRPYVPAGIVGSGELGSKMREEADAERISFPPFMPKVNEMTCGGIMLGKIVNIGAASGIGKTVYVDECIYYWIFNSPYRVGVVSMELNAGQYGLSMLSRHIGRKINNIVDRQERMDYLNSPEVLEAERNLFYRDDGSHRFHLVDDRDGSIEALKSQVEKLVVACECKVIVLDPIQDILDGLTNEEQAVFLKWQKGMIKSHNITFININHVRKSSSGGKQNSNGAMISEEDFAGSSTIFKSGALNILLVRDKMNEDPVIRNTTQVFISKNRDNSNTGPAGEVYYESATHKLHDMESWLKKTGATDF